MLTSVERHREKVCFICGINDTEFEKHGISFEEHKANEHDMWSYLSYIKYLDGLDVLKMTKTEYYVYCMMLKNNIQWFPLERAKAIEDQSIGLDDDDEDNDEDSNEDDSG